MCLTMLIRGIMAPKPGDLTTQGYDIQWGGFFGLVLGSAREGVKVIVNRDECPRALLFHGMHQACSSSDIERAVSHCQYF